MEPDNPSPDTGVDTTFDIDSIDVKILKLLANTPMYKSQVADHIPRSVQSVGRRIDTLENRGLLNSELTGLEAGKRITQVYKLTDDGYDVLRWKMQELAEQCETLQERIESLQDKRKSLATVIS